MVVERCETVAATVFRCSCWIYVFVPCVRHTRICSKKGDMESGVWRRAAEDRSQNDGQRAHNFSKLEMMCDSLVKKGPKARIRIWDLDKKGVVKKRRASRGVTVTLPQLLNLANLRARSSFRPDGARSFDGDDDRHLRSWRRKLVSSLTAVKLKLTWTSAFRFALLLFLLAAIATACISLPIEKSLKDFLLWIKQDLGPWGPLVLAVSYVPLTVLAVPASVLTLGGGYLFGLPVGFIADSIGATLGATAAFILGRTIGRSYVISKLKHYPKFQAVAVAIQRSGFKIVLLLRLAPLLPFNMLNYLLSVTPVHIGDYMLATWLGMMPITFALVYVGTTLKDLSDVTHGWNEVSTTRWVFIVLGFGISVILLICISKVAKASLEKALADNAEIEGIFSSSTLPIVAGSFPDLPKTLIIQIDS